MTDFQRRVCVTLVALAAYRLGSHIPLPGIDLGYLLPMTTDSSSAEFDDSFQLAIGWFSQFSIFALGVIPYLTAAVLMRLASGISQRLRSSEYRSPLGRQKIVRVTQLLAILIAGLEGLAWASGFDVTPGLTFQSGPVFRLGIAATMTTGFVIVMWLSDQITQRGVGNGIALIVFSDIVVELPDILAATIDLINTRTVTLGLAISLLLFSVAVVTGIVFIERAVRHVWVRYPKADFGDRTFGGGYSSIPLKLNNAGIIPTMIAAWLLQHAFYLATIAMAPRGNYETEVWLRWGIADHPVHMAISAILIMAMTYIYTAALLDPADTAKRLQEQGALALDVSPGVETERAFRRLLRGLSFFGAVYLTLIYLLPLIQFTLFPVQSGWIGGIGFLIATAVAMDTLADLAHRWKQDYGEPVGEEFADAIAVAIEIPDQPQIREKGLSEAGR